MGNWKKAYLNSEKHIALDDSLNSAKFKNEIVTLEAKFKKTENARKNKPAHHTKLKIRFGSQKQL